MSNSSVTLDQRTKGEVLVSEQYDSVANYFESPSEPDGHEALGFVFNECVPSVIEVRQMQMADPWLALSMVATRNPGRVLDLLKLCSVGIT